MRLLVAIDGSEASATASAFLADLLGDHAHDITAISVAAVPPTAPMLPEVGIGGGFGAPVGLLAGVHHEAAPEGIEAALERAAALAPPGAQIEAAVGDPATEILRIAENIDADLIVMGTHDVGVIDRLLRGSVSRSVVRKAERPVLVVR